jgi:hypothetical protein
VFMARSARVLPFLARAILEVTLEITGWLSGKPL